MQGLLHSREELEKVMPPLSHSMRKCPGEQKCFNDGCPEVPEFGFEAGNGYYVWYCPTHFAQVALTMMETKPYAGSC